MHKKKRAHSCCALPEHSKPIKIYQSNLIGQIILQAPDNAFLQP